MLVLMSLTYADKLGHFECSVHFWQLFCLDVFWLVFDFCLFQKMDQRISIKFCVKNKIKCADAFRMLIVVYGEATLDSHARHSRSPRPKKARQVRSNVKVLLTVFCDCSSVVHHEFLPQGRTVNKEYYLQITCNLREAIRQKRPDLWKNKNWLLHYDNASVHTSLLVRKFLAKNNTLMMPQHRGPLWLFLVPKTEEAHERTTLRHDWGDEGGIEGGAEQDHKKWFFEVLRGMEKTLAQVYNFWWGLLWRA